MQSFPSRRGRRVLTLLSGVGPESTQGMAGDEVALDVEGVVDGGMNREKPLR
jgi:hypothetical protein